MQNKKIKDWINSSYETVGAAIGGQSKQIAYNLRAVGKRCSPRFVRQQGEVADIVRANFYENFLRWIAAIHYANHAGFELLWTDLELFVRELRRSDKQIHGTYFPSATEKSLAAGLVKIRLETSKLFDLLEVQTG